MRGKVDGDAEEGIEGAVHEGSSESGQPDGVENKLAESCGFGDDQKGDGQDRTQSATAAGNQFGLLQSNSCSKCCAASLTTVCAFTLSSDAYEGRKVFSGG